MDVDPRCPDCGVTMEEMTLKTADYSSHVNVVSDERQEGLMGKLGVKQKYRLVPYVCPECSLTRLYADVDES